MYSKATCGGMALWKNILNLVEYKKAMILIDHRL